MKTDELKRLEIAEHSAEANRAWLAQFDAYKKRIAAMAALLDILKHDVMLVADGNGIACAVKCNPDCPRCAWERMKKEKE